MYKMIKTTHISFSGLLAGNVFDWGAKEVALLMESGEGLNFSDALTFVKPRPWLVDDLDLWKERLRTKKPHKCAAIFIDNSGFDVVLGIFPFVVEMLRYVQYVSKEQDQIQGDPN